jgi:hypothetical protein
MFWVSEFLWILDPVFWKGNRPSLPIKGNRKKNCTHRTSIRKHNPSNRVANDTAATVLAGHPREKRKMQWHSHS